MARRETTNQTGILRIPNIQSRDAWVSYVCVACKSSNLEKIGRELISPTEAYNNSVWVCQRADCMFSHSSHAPLPFQEWPDAYTEAGSDSAKGFWRAFFRAATYAPQAFWKQCGTCGRILPFADFARHQGRTWRPLELQIECRACKATINTTLNPLRTQQQMFEANATRRIADLIVKDLDQPIDKAFLRDLFERFESKCFHTGKPLKLSVRKEWAIDHTLPSRYLWPLTIANATLLSREANDLKRDHWPSRFYDNSQLIRLAQITGANLRLLSRKEPEVNSNIDVNQAVVRLLQGRNKSNLHKRIEELCVLLRRYNLVDKLSIENRQLLDL